MEQKKVELDYVELFTKYLGPGRSAGSQVAFKCFRCDHGDSRHLYLDPKTGLYCCFKCMHLPDKLGRGTAQQFAKMFGETAWLVPAPGVIEGRSVFDYATAVRVYTRLVESLPLLDEHRRVVVEARGIDPAQFGVKSCVGAEELLCSEFSEDELVASGLFFCRDGSLIPHRSLRPGLIIPYITRKGHVVFLRNRALDPDAKPKYISPIGCPAGRHVWGPVPYRADEVLVTEGEFKAMAALSAGVNALALPGMNVAHDRLIEILGRIRGLKRVCICFDTQLKMPEMVDCAARALAVRIKEQLGLQVARLRLPLDRRIEGGRKTDIDGYIRVFGKEDFVHLVADAPLI